MSYMPDEDHPTQPIEEDRLDDIGLRIVAARERAHLTTTELAKIAGLEYPTLYRIEKGQREPGVQIIRKIAKALHLTTSQLLGEGSSGSQADIFEILYAKTLLDFMSGLNIDPMLFLEDLASLPANIQALVELQVQSWIEHLRHGGDTVVRNPILNNREFPGRSTALGNTLNETAGYPELGWYAEDFSDYADESQWGYMEEIDPRLLRRLRETGLPDSEIEKLATAWPNLPLDRRLESLEAYTKLARAYTHLRDVEAQNQGQQLPLPLEFESQAESVQEQPSDVIVALGGGTATTLPRTQINPTSMIGSDDSEESSQLFEPIPNEQVLANVESDEQTLQKTSVQSSDKAVAFVDGVYPDLILTPETEARMQTAEADLTQAVKKLHGRANVDKELLYQMDTVLFTTKRVTNTVRNAQTSREMLIDLAKEVQQHDPTALGAYVDVNLDAYGFDFSSPKLDSKLATFLQDHLSNQEYLEILMDGWSSLSEDSRRSNVRLILLVDYLRAALKSSEAGETQPRRRKRG